MINKEKVDKDIDLNNYKIENLETNQIYNSE